MGKSFILRSLYFTLYCTRTLTVSTASWEWTHEANKQNANKLKSIFISNNSFIYFNSKVAMKGTFSPSMLSS